MPRRGSAHHLARYVNDHPGALDDALIRACSLDGPVRWVSPLRGERYREYQDGAFLEALDAAELVDALKDWWPSGGPVWDALGIARDGTLVLVEAKANVPEMSSSTGSLAGHSGSLRGMANRELIEQSLAATRRWLGVHEQHGVDWIASSAFQYANRLAHLHFLLRHGRKTVLAYACFTDDHTYLPTTSEQFAAQHRHDHHLLGLTELDLPNVARIYLPALDAPQSMPTRESLRLQRSPAAARRDQPGRSGDLE